MYYIPTDFWVPQHFPREPPIVYVVPTRDMLVRRSANVDPSGRVTTDYLRAWLRKPEVCDAHRRLLLTDRAVISLSLIHI